MGWRQTYPRLSGALAPEYRALPRDQVEQVVRSVFGEGTEPAEGLRSPSAIRHWLERGERSRRPVKLQDDLKKWSCYPQGEEMTSRNQSFTQSTLGEPH